MLRRLTSYIRQQHLGLLALFVALGGSAYAAATINSASVVDNSLTGADIRGRAASNGKPFTQGTLTGDDIKGSAAAPGRPAVNGSVTGADIFDNSLTAADILEASLGKVPNADRLDALDSSNFVQTSQQAGDAAKLGGKDPSAYGSGVYTNSQLTASCGTTNQYNDCAPITVTIPAGGSYEVIVWSSFTAKTGPTVMTVYWCAAGKAASSGTLPSCLTESGAVENGTTAPGGGVQLSGASTSRVQSFGAGTYKFSTVINPNAALASDASAYTTTTVMITDATAPSPPHDVCLDGCGTTSGGSSGTTSSGASTGGSSGSTSSGATSGGSSGSTSSGATSGGSSGSTSSGATSGGSSGSTSGG
ncbi:MAG: hypothetical protein QOE86_76 [Solirubrobacteraceae bacterium]|jgi:hypothetical protein|nr:hypothetical protein [Solirubrobacteraceae bacterium]